MMRATIFDLIPMDGHPRRSHVQIMHKIDWDACAGASGIAGAHIEAFHKAIRMHFKQLAE